MSDHVGGPRSIGEPAADVTVLIAFTTPENPVRRLTCRARPMGRSPRSTWEARAVVPGHDLRRTRASPAAAEAILAAQSLGDLDALDRLEAARLAIRTRR